MEASPVSMWPDGSDEPKEIGFCPKCGEQEPDAYEVEDGWHPHNPQGNLICAECENEEEIEREYVPVKVIPLESANLAE